MSKRKGPISSACRDDQARLRIRRRRDRRAQDLADERGVSIAAVQGITDIIQLPGQINVDFADVRSVMKGMGHAVMGIGMGEGPLRALTAAQRAVSNPLLENSSMQGAKSIVVNITGGADLSLAETSEATSFIRASRTPRPT